MAKQRIGMDVDGKLWNRLKAYAKKRGMLLQAAFAEVLRGGLAKEEERESRK